MDGTLRVRHARLLDGLGSAAQSDIAVAVEDGRISGISADPGTPLEPNDVDASGLTVLPGFINLHSHLFRRRRADDPAVLRTYPPVKGTVAEVARALRNAREAMGQGITTTRELGARDYLDLELRDLINDGYVVGPRIFAGGRPITQTGGHNFSFGIEADGPEEVRKAVRSAIKAGVDVIKVMASMSGIHQLNEHRRMRLPGDPPPAPAAYSVDEMRAAVEAAHESGRRVTVHAVSSESILRAVAAGVDSIEHGTHMTDEIIDVLVETGTPLVPTISTVFSRLAHVEKGVGPAYPQDMIGWARLDSGPWMDSLGRAVAAGVHIAVGTDAGGDMLTEIQLLVEAGLQPIEAIRSATSRAAEVLGRTDLGAIEVGRVADLLIMEGNPDINPAAVRDIRSVISEGRLYSIDSLRAEFY